MVYLGPNTLIRYRRKSEADTGTTKDNFTEKDFLGIIKSAEFPDPKVEVINVTNIGNGREKIYTTVLGKKDYEGTISLVPTEPKHLRWAFGDVTITGTNSTTKTATYKPVKKAHLPGIELDVVSKDSPGARRLFRGTVMKSLEISAEMGGLVEAEIGVASMIGFTINATDPLDPAGYAAATVTNSTDSGSPAGTGVVSYGDTPFPYNTSPVSNELRPYIFGDVQIKLLAGGVVFCPAKSARIGIDNNILIQHYLCRTSGREPSDIIAQMPSFTAEVTILPEDRRVLNELYSGTVVFDMEMEATQLSSESGKNVIMRITAKDCFIESAPHGAPDDGPVEVTVTLHPRTITYFIQDERTTVNTSEYDILAGDFIGLNTP